jgi:hypothetical protein
MLNRLVEHLRVTDSESVEKYGLITLARRPLSPMVTNVRRALCTDTIKLRPGS